MIEIIDTRSGERFTYDPVRDATALTIKLVETGLHESLHRQGIQVVRHIEPVPRPVKVINGKRKARQS